MDKTIEGTIISSQLGTFGKDDVFYGYIGIKTTSGENIKVKVDNYTEYDTLEIGSDVIAEIHSLGSTNILVAKRISEKGHGSEASDQHVMAGT